MEFEREVTQEIWRTPLCTFTVVYPTSSMVSVKGLRGTLDIKDYMSIAGILSREGYTTLVFERLDENDTLVEKYIKLTERHKKLSGSTFERVKK